MLAWLLSGWIHIAIGFVIGWLFFKRPDIADNAWRKIWGWIKGLFSKTPTPPPAPQKK